MNNPSIEPLDQEINGPLLLPHISDLHITQVKYADFLTTDKHETCVMNNSLTQHDDVSVDMGYTHYNELANDGQVIFSATRFTDQIEEGLIGYSLISVDKGIVSWRFNPRYHAFLFVLTTSPADYRLRRDETPYHRKLYRYARSFLTLTPCNGWRIDSLNSSGLPRRYRTISGFDGLRAMFHPLASQH